MQKGQKLFKVKKNRISELIRTYSVFPDNELKNSVKKISKRLGPQRTKRAIEAIGSKNWEDVCNAVLDYYDKCYDYELANNLNVNIIDIQDKEENEIIELITKEEN